MLSAYFPSLSDRVWDILLRAQARFLQFKWFPFYFNYLHFSRIGFDDDDDDNDIVA